MDKETLIARGRVIQAELNKTLAAIAEKGVTVDYNLFSSPKIGSRVDAIRFELSFSEITKVDL